ncbi:hypothetical protein AAG906_026380 [Vitis piasezkii]
MSMLFASEKETGSFFTPVPSHLGVINPASINDITRLGILDLFHGVYIALGVGIVDALTHDESDPKLSKPESRMVLFGLTAPYWNLVGKLVASYAVAPASENLNPSTSIVLSFTAPLLTMVARKRSGDTLRAAVEADLTFAQAIVDSAWVIVQSADLTICYGSFEGPEF